MATTTNKKPLLTTPDKKFKKEYYNLSEMLGIFKQLNFPDRSDNVTIPIKHGKSRKSHPKLDSISGSSSGINSSESSPSTSARSSPIQNLNSDSYDLNEKSKKINSKKIQPARNKEKARFDKNTLICFVNEKFYDEINQTDVYQQVGNYKIYNLRNGIDAARHEHTKERKEPFREPLPGSPEKALRGNNTSEDEPKEDELKEKESDSQRKLQKYCQDKLAYVNQLSTKLINFKSKNPPPVKTKINSQPPKKLYRPARHQKSGPKLTFHHNASHNHRTVRSPHIIGVGLYPNVQYVPNGICIPQPCNVQNFQIYHQNRYIHPHHQRINVFTKAMASLPSNPPISVPVHITSSKNHEHTKLFRGEYPDRVRACHGQTDIKANLNSFDKMG